MKEKAGREAAETLGLRVLAWLVGSPDALRRFLGSSGVSPDDLRDRADDPQVLGAAIDFLLANEAYASEFCTGEGVQPRELQVARHRLEGTP